MGGRIRFQNQKIAIENYEYSDTSTAHLLTRGVVRGALGAKPPLGPVKSMNFKAFVSPKWCLAPPLEKKCKPLGKITDYASDFNN